MNGLVQQLGSNEHSLYFGKEIRYSSNVLLPPGFEPGSRPRRGRVLDRTRR